MVWGAARKMPARLMAAVCLILLPVAFGLITGFMLFEERVAVGRAAEQQADNIATALQNDLEHAFSIANAALNDVKTGLPVIEKQAFSPRIQQMILFDSAMREPDYGAVLVLNERGNAIYDSRLSVPRSGDFSGRSWFKTLRDNAASEAVVDLDPRGFSGQPVITLSRGLKRADGSFGGIVVATIRLSLLKGMFGSLHLGGHDDVLLQMGDGRGIYRRSTGSTVFGEDLSSEQRPSTEPQSTLGGLVSVADSGYILGTRQLSSLPLTIVVSLSRRDIYAAWWSGAEMVGEAVTFLLLVAGVLAFRLRRELRGRERAEAGVRESELKFRLLADSASDMISRVNRMGERDYVSPAAERLIGVPPEHLLGQSVWEYIDPRDREVVTEARHSFDGAVTPLSACFRIIRADGEQRWIESLARPILNSITRLPDGYISSWRDITDRKLVELRLSENEAQYRALADNASDIITSLDLDLCRTYVSPAVRIVLGFEPEELVGASPIEIMHPDDRAEAAGLLQRLQSGHSEREELTCRLRHSLGHYVWIEGKLALIRNSATAAPTSILCSIRDISERRAQQETLLAANLGLERLSRHLVAARDAAQRANSAKSRFLANVSHELRTPLNGILGYTQLLRIEGGLTPKQAARVESMLGAGQHLLEMINGVLDISEIEAGHFELRPAPTDLMGVSSACLDLIRPAAESKKIDLGLTIADDLPRRVIVDPTRLRQVLLNLLGNAVKYTAIGRIQLRLCQGDLSTLRVEVVDTGPGIALDQRERLFQDFDRLGLDTVSEVEGAGIGLALSHRLTTAMGGTIGYDDNPAGGSLFWFELPLQSDHVADGGETVDDPSEKDLRDISLEILVVDDVAINRDVTTSFLRLAGHRATCATSGEEAVRAAARSSFDLILMDVRMPGIGGLEATRQIRSLPGSAGAVPIAALTAQAFAEEIAACRAAGMDAHLTKPFTQAALRDVLKQAIDVNYRRRSMMDASPADVPVVPAAESPALIDLSVFEQVLDTLPAEKVYAHMRALIDRTGNLLGSLSSDNAFLETVEVIESSAMAAHVIAGSAGVFGFLHLAEMARDYEHAALYAPNQLSQIRAKLIAAAAVSLNEMETRLVDVSERSSSDTSSHADVLMAI